LGTDSAHLALDLLALGELKYNYLGYLLKDGVTMSSFGFCQDQFLFANPGILEILSHGY